MGSRMIKALFLAEAYGENEAAINKPMVGATGIELFKLLDEVGYIQLTHEDKAFIKKFWDLGDPRMIDMIWNLHPELYRTNVFNRRPRGNKIEDFCCSDGERPIPGYPNIVKTKRIRIEFQSELDRLAEELCTINPNLVVAMGNTACWAMLGQTTISKLRGSTCMSTHTVTDFKVLPTYHPAAIFQQYEIRPTVVIDLMKAKREAEYPDIRRPHRTIWIEPTLADCYRFYEEHIKGCEILSVDIENPGGPISCIGFAPRSDLALVVPITAGRSRFWKSKENEKKAWQFIKMVCEDRKVRKVFQNGMYDIAVLLRGYGIKTYNASEDTMLLHHALQPEALKGLGFLGSVYTDEGSWKQLRKRATTLKRDD
jgi:uracil-DNA glycosylase